MSIAESTVAKLKKEWFLVGMLLAIALAMTLPDLGRSGGIIGLGQSVKIGIAMIFFLHGLQLAPKAIRSGLGNWRLHCYIQLTTFFLYPLLWVLFGRALLAWLPSALAFGFCYLFVLPSTMSSSVALTGVAKGNVSAAILNASLSNILGVLATPLLLRLFINQNTGGIALDMTASVIPIVKLLLIPMIAGQLARPLLAERATRHKALLSKVDRVVILLVVYNVFSDSVARGVWQEFSLVLLLTSIAICTVVLFAMACFVQWGALRCRFSLPDKATAIFCGAQKSLASGVPMAKAIFGSSPVLGMILLPIMLYHPIQIIYCAVLANRIREKTKEE